MKISYHEDTDSLYVCFSLEPTEESEEVGPDTVLHFDADGEVTGIEFYAESSEKVDVSRIQVAGLEVERLEVETQPEVLVYP